MEIMAKLKTTTLSEGDFQYITDYAENERGRAIFADSIWQEARVQIAFERNERLKAEEQKQKAEEQKQKAEEEKQSQQKRVIRKSLKKGNSFEDIADLLGIDRETFDYLLVQIKKEDSN